MNNIFLASICRLGFRYCLGRVNVFKIYFFCKNDILFLLKKVVPITNLMLKSYAQE